MNKLYAIFILGLSCVFTACTSDVEHNRDNTKYVNPFIGTGGHGHTFPGAVVPNGMVQLSPDARTKGWDACGGYHHTDTSIKGFSHTHLSGTGIGDLGDFLFMPFTGENKLNPGTNEAPDEGYRSRFSHTNEIAEPGYYFVDLLDYNIKAELTASKRVGFHKYQFEEGAQKKLLIDFVHSLQNRNVVNSGVEVISDKELRGYRQMNGWAPDRYIYFHAVFSQPFDVEIFNKGLHLKDAKTAQGKKLLSVLTFKDDVDETLMVKVGISSVDYNGAKKNLTQEIPHWDFDTVKEQAKTSWKKQLSKIDVEGGTLDEKTIFYTGLYHAALSPYVFNDVDGRYKGMDGKIHQDTATVYTVFSLWDTFRAFHPLLNITEPEKNNAFVNSLLKKYEHGGILPKWELNANYTGTMIGYHAVPVIVDAYMKGIKDFDVEKAYEAIVHASKFDTLGFHFPNRRIKMMLSPMGKYYNEKLGYIPSDLENESVSKALEFAYNDWCIAQMAKDLGKNNDYKEYMERSKRYVKYFDPKTGFMRGVESNGTFREPFDPAFSRHREDDYVEGNAWQWSWFVPHDVDGLVDLMGGKEKFVTKLDELFSTSSELKGEKVSGDITGLIGQYAHGNEPSHHITHLYNYVD